MSGLGFYSGIAMVAMATMIVGAFLIGGIPFGYLAGRLKGIDVRTVGSGSIGATNTRRALGSRWGIAVLMLDALKGLLPVVVSRLLAAQEGWGIGAWVVPVVALAAVAGHCYTPYLRFNGGKGFATTLGVLLGLNFWVALGVVAVFFLVAWRWRYVSLGSLVAAVAQVPLFALLTPRTEGNFAPATYAATVAASVGIALIVVTRHSGNIQRLRNGTERRLGADNASPPTGGA